jgi:ribonuclease P protein component
MRKATLRRGERLRGAKPISALFQKSFSVGQFPFRINWVLAQPSSVPVRVVFVVSARRFKKAVTRNRIRRVLRELYRLNKYTLLDFCEDKKTHLNIALMYHGSDEVAYHQLLQTYLRLLDKFKADVAKHID